MRKIPMQLLVLFTFLTAASHAQLVNFTFNTAPFISADAVVPNVSVSTIELSAGTWSTNVSTGTYFIDEPYLEESGSWAETSFFAAKYVYFDLIPDAGYQISLTELAFDLYVTAAGPSAIGLVVNNDSIFSSSIGESILHEISIPLNQVDLTSAIRIKVLGWDDGSRSTTGGGAFRIDNLRVDGSVNLIPPMDSNSTIVATDFNEPLLVSSLTTTYPGVNVMQFYVVDSATTDNAPTLVDSLKFAANAHNGIDEWTKVLQEIYLHSAKYDSMFEGTINDNALQFTFDTPMQISQGIENKDTLSLYLQLKEDVHNLDNEGFGFVLDAGQVFCSASGSQLGSGQISTPENALIIDVLASQLRGHLSSSEVFINNAFSYNVFATDKFGNLDKDYADEVELEVHSLTTQNLVYSTNHFFNNAQVQFKDMLFAETDTLNFKFTSLTTNGFDSAVVVSSPLFCDTLNNLVQWEDTVHWEKLGKTISHALQDTAGTSYISASYMESNFNQGHTTWNLNVKNEDFDPSSSNKFWYFLMSDKAALDASNNFGYAVGVNLVGSSDTLSLYKIDEEGAVDVLISSTLNWEPNTNAFLEIKRSQSGQWKLAYDTSLNRTNPIESESIYDHSFNNLMYHGMVFNFTDSRAGKLTFEPLLAKQMNTAPEILTVEFIKDAYLQVVCNEPFNADGLSEPNNFSLINASGVSIFPQNIQVNTQTNTINLYFDAIEDGFYRLIVHEIRDLLGKENLDLEWGFYYEKGPEKYSLVVNELLYDNYPEQNLPKHDFIELYNASEDTLNMEKWSLSIGEQNWQFPKVIVAPSEYLIISTNDGVKEYNTWGAALGLFASNALTNYGKSIVLQTETGKLMDSIFYSPEWVTDEEKRVGGWSLERMDYKNTCGRGSNWQASIDLNGGTPGKENSNYQNNLDVEPPVLVSVYAVENNILQIQFNEELGEDVLELLHSFELNGRVPDSAIHKKDNSYSLFFDVIMESKQSYVLNVNNIKDPCDNFLLDTAIPFVYYKTRLFDVVFSEIMEDAVPSRGLPELEYVEIYNRSSYPIYMDNWYLDLGGTKKEIECGVLPASSYAILCSDKLDFEAYGSVFQVSGGLSLSSSGKLTLYTNKGGMLAQLNYTSNWIKDEFKQEGGFSVERLDLNNFMNTEENWTASSSDLGGTPGSVNSVNTLNPDFTPFNLLNVLPLSQNKLLLSFSKPFDASLIQLNQINVNPQKIQPVSLKVFNANLHHLECSFKDSFTKGIRYELSVDSKLMDASGNPLEQNTQLFKLTDAPLASDFIINEVLFNPFPDGVDFVEIYNNSDKAIDVGKTIIATRDDEGNIKSPKLLHENGYLLMPSAYLILSESVSNVESNYWIPEHVNYINVDKMPAFSNDAGTVVLMDTLGQIIDEFSYAEDMHFNLIHSAEGISLERISFKGKTQDNHNWHSAAQSVGWATPGYENSMHSAQLESNTNFSIYPEAFSPDSDGYHDVLQINYDMKEPGYLANLTIMDDQGRLIRRLVANQLLETDGTFTWDGLDNNQQRVPMGIYIIWFEYYNLTGELGRLQKACVVSSKF